ncbi:ABC transporter ATP-binding protein [Lacticaseibacillus parahuelsenbergensis]|uniref:ABC transporter ATP-binding protein n=1 Tax=Lacticaseibacillus parahuelsenbergensis TaxID=3068305 RepID=A0ABY9L075_9LACO|nr:ABC transporter ATP-binding protein [Lacticaseibacillus sp. NCIMB 15471]WLV77050.1 ABC transporter ATP-binding protein [Lacticaseibacillus sp. NCIMB 15471]
MQTIFQIGSIKKRWLLGLPSLRVAVDGFNVAISMLIQLGLIAALAGQVGLLLGIFGGMLSASVVYTGVYWLSGVVVERLKRRLSLAIATALVSSFLGGKADEAPDSGLATNLLVTDTQNIMQFLDTGVLPLVDFGITVILGIAYVATQSWQLALAFILIGLGFAVLSRQLFRYQNQAQTALIGIDDRHKGFFNDFLANFAMVRNLHVFAYIRQRHQAFFQEATPSIKQLANAAGALSGIFNGGIYLAEVLTLVLGFALLPLTQQSVASVLGAWNAGVGSILWPFLGLAPTIGYFAQQKTSLQRILPRLQVASEVPITTNTKIAAIPDQPMTIVGEQVTFHYPNNSRQLLHNLNFQIDNHGITFIIGANGAGKTTLMKLILGELLPTSGHIGIRGRPTATSPAELMAFVPQRSVMFTASVAANLLLVEDHSSQRIMPLLHQLGLEKYADDVDQILHPAQLSPGEQRRFGIARALLSGRPWLVLDEPFSDIDAANQAVVMRILRQEARRRGIIVITHTFDFVTAADHIIKVGEQHD